LRRSRKEILLDILELLAEHSLKKTEIMYKCNLSWQTTTDALEELIDRKFVLEESVLRRQKYGITNRGKKTLRLHNTLRKEFE
jgi:predicted transcriptional regulator